MTRIIKSTLPPTMVPRQQAPGTTRVLHAGLVQDRQEMQRLLHQAEAQALALVHQAEQEALTLRQQALTAGRAEAGAMLVAAGHRAQQTIEEAQSQLTRLAVNIAEKLLGEQLRLEPETVLQIVRQALRVGATSRRLTLRVHSADLALVEGALADLKGNTEAEVLLAQADPTVERGGCLLDTDLGQIDGQLSTQLKAIAEALQK
jgi:flagellar assembly protein FliH